MRARSNDGFVYSDDDVPMSCRCTTSRRCTAWCCVNDCCQAWNVLTVEEDDVFPILVKGHLLCPQNHVNHMVYDIGCT